MRKGGSQQRARVTTRARAARRTSNVHDTSSPGSPVRWSSSPAVGKKRAPALATPNAVSQSEKDQRTPLKKRGPKRPESGGKPSKASVSDKEAGLSRRDQKWASALTKSRQDSLGTPDSMDRLKRLSNGLVCVVKMDQCDTPRQRSSANAVARSPDKTPKRSPQKLVSPKSRSVKSKRLSKTPRGVSLAMKSPKSLQKYGTPMMKERKLPSGDSGGKSNRLSLDAKHVLRRFSKSPKIVLRSPKPKSKAKQKSPTLNVSRKSFFSKDTGNRRGKSSSSPNKSIREGKVKRAGTPAVNHPDISVQSPSIAGRYKEILLRKPIVLLHRLSPKATNDKAGKSPRLERSSRKRSEQTVDGSVKLAEAPLMSSTPQDEKKRAFRDSSSPREAKTINPGRSSRPNRSGTVSVPEPKVNGGSIEDESEPSFSELEPSTDSSNNQQQQQQQTISRRNSNRLRKELLSVTGEPRKEDEVNRTYELLEPQTPQLRKGHRKRSLLEVSEPPLARTKETTVAGRSTRSGSPKQRSLNRMEPPPGPSAKRMKPHVQTPRPVKVSIEGRSSGGRTALVKPRKRSVSAPTTTTTPAKTPARLEQRPGPFSTGKPGLTLGHNQPSAGSASKYSATKKLPNFSEIHKKLFSRAESITDAKRRLESRHRALTQPHASVSQAAKPTGGIPRSLGYNRFGFKLRKDEAIDRVMGKRDLRLMEKQKKETRQLVKGVRMNRRFELQMRARKLNG